MNESVAVDLRGDVLTARLSGDWDLSNVHRLEEALEPALADKPQVLAVDLGAVGFMDSTGVRWLLRTEQAVAGYGGNVRIVDASPPVRRLFDVAGLSAHFGLSG